MTNLYALETLVRVHQQEMLEAAQRVHALRQARADQGKGLANLLIKAGVWTVFFNAPDWTDKKTRDV